MTTGSQKRAWRGALNLAGATVALLMVSTGFAAANDAVPNPDTVVATVNGDPVTEADLATAAAQYAQELSRVPVAQRREQMLNVLIDVRLFAKAAEDAGMDKDAEFQRTLAFMRARALRNEYLQKKVLIKVDDAAIKKRFDEEIAKFVPQDQVHVSHILVKTEDEAKAIIAELDKGGDFAAIAKKKSLDPGSAPKGGDLGFIAKGQTVKPFEDAAFALKDGEYTKQPVQSQYGWHVLKAEGRRKEPAPTLEAETPRIRNELLREAFTAEVAALHSAADIKIMDAGAKKGATAPGGGAAKTDGANTTAPAK